MTKISISEEELELEFERIVGLFEAVWISADIFVDKQ